MNQNFRNIKIEDVLFFDAEVVKNQDSINIESKEFKLFRKKIRDKETDELPSIEDTISEYNRVAGLKMTYNKVVCISVGAVKEGKLYLKSYTGDEKIVIESFYKKTQEYNYIAGMNVIFYDLPTIRVNALRHGDIILNLPDKYNDSAKKEWELKSVIDLMNYFKGSHYMNSSLDEISEHLGLPSSKEDGIDGSQVSKVYYEGGISAIEKYCKRDVLNCVNIFQKFQFKEPYLEFIDVDLLNVPEVTEEQPILTKLFKTKQFNDEVKDYLKSLKITKKDKPTVEKLVLSHYLEIIDVMAQNKKELTETNKQRTEEVKEFFKTLK